MSARQIILRTAVGLVAGIGALAGSADSAYAATGGYVRGVLSCHDLLGIQERIVATAPQVWAANTTPAVDRQWVYWRARVVLFHTDQVGNETRSWDSPWSPWSSVLASDNYRTQAFTTRAFYWDHLRSGGLSYRAVLNQVWYFSNGRWELGGQFYSAPGEGAGGQYGMGLCDGG